MSTSTAFPPLPQCLITISLQNITQPFANVSILDFTFASVLLTVAIVFLVSTSFAGAVVASVGIIAAICDVCGVCRCGFDRGCESNSTREVRDVSFDDYRYWIT
jgi:hypothetical protein